MLRRLLQEMWAVVNFPRLSRPKRRMSKVHGVWHESLEDRRLLSATSGIEPVLVTCESGSKVSELSVPVERQQRKANANLPDMNGTWRITVHYEGFDLGATLVLSQRGKRVTGTWQNDGQFAGKFKGKFVIERDTATSLARAKTGKPVLKAKTENPAQVSPPKTVNVRAAIVAGLIDGVVGTPEVGDAVFDGAKVPLVP